MGEIDLFKNYLDLIELLAKKEEKKTPIRNNNTKNVNKDTIS